MADLPLVDEHSVEVDAPADAVWSAVSAVLDGSFGGTLATAYARAVGCEPARASGPRPLDVGSTIPGFRIARATPAELVLEGRHRFSTYALTFRLDGRRLSATTRAAFPGVHGRAYRLAVVGTGFHVRAVRRLLAMIAARA